MRDQVLWIIIGILFLLFLGYALQVSAIQINEARVLGRVCYGEGTTDKRGKLTHDCRSIYAVLTLRAARSGVHWTKMARWYSGAHLNPIERASRRPKDRRPWIPFLRANGDKPLAWASTMPWDGKHRDRWMKIYRHAGDVIAGRAKATCKPVHWGSTQDWRRFYKAYPYAYEVDCGPTNNVFIKLGPRR